jgi:hypothetical protein
MDFPSKRFLRRTAGAVIGVSALAFLLNAQIAFTSDLSLIINLCVLGSYGIAGAIAIAGARQIGLESYLGKAFLTIGVGMLCMVSGFLVEDYFKFVLQVDVPYPSFADVFFFLYTPLVVVGLWMFLKIHSMRVTRRLLLEAAALTVACVAISFLCLGSLTLGERMAILELFRGNAVDAHQVAAEAMSAVYLATDAVYLALAALIARVSAGKMSAGLFLFAIGIALMTAADVAYSIVIENGTYLEGDVADQLFLAAGFAQAIGLTFVVRPFVGRFTGARAATPGTTHA